MKAVMRLCASSLALLLGADALVLQNPGSCLERFHARRGMTTVMSLKPSQPVPRNIKDTLKSLRAAVQEALRGRCSRMDVEIPFGSRLGVEGVDKDALVNAEQSDRELARVFIEMFDPIGDATVVAFRTEAQAQKAKSIWVPGTYKGAVQAMAAPKATVKKAGKKSRAGGFAKKMEAAMADSGTMADLQSIVPAGTEVFIMVAPEEKELKMVEELNLGQDCLCILLNARLDMEDAAGRVSITKQTLSKTFEGVFHLRAIGDGSSEDFLYRAYPRDWSLLRKPAIGPPKLVQAFATRPSASDIETALAQKTTSNDGIFGGLF